MDEAAHVDFHIDVITSTALSQLYFCVHIIESVTQYIGNETLSAVQAM